MKRSYKFLAFGSSFAMMLGLASCANDLSDQFTQNESGSIQLVHAPDVIAWSGDQVLGNSFSSRSTNPATRSYNLNYGEVPEFSGFDTESNGSPSFERWQSDRSWSLPNDIIEAERDYVLQYLQNNPNGGYKTLDVYNYIIQVVGGGHHSYKGDTKDHNGSWQEVSDATNQMNYCVIDGFFTQFNNTGMNSENAILIKNVQATNATYHDSYGNTTQENHYAFYFITFPDEEQYGYMAGKTGLYLCYDYATYKESEKWGVTADGKYDDWVIKLSPYNGSDIVITYPDPEEETCEQCGHESHGDNICPKCQEEGEGGCYEDEDIEEGEKNPILHNNEVEVNYAILDRHDNIPNNISDLATKLSIHVRKGTDVRITIPLEGKYLCESDDFAILEKHYEDNSVYTGTKNPTELWLDNEHQITYSFPELNLDVTLTVGIYSDGIVVYTDGITQELIDYLFEKNGDGINFEIWNYFDNKHDEEFNFEVSDLLEKMNNSTIEFLDEVPDYYINAFGYQDIGEEGYPDGINPEHASVKPVQEAISVKENRIHLNGTPYNTIYYYTEDIDDGHIHSGECPKGKHDNHD